MSVLVRLSAAAALFASSFLALDAYERAMTKVEYLSIPASVTVHAAAAGWENIVADTLYLQFINYFGKHMRAKRKYHNVAPMLDLITDLDPRFEGAYLMGALALGDNGQVDESEALWNKGVRANPKDWAYAYQAGMSLFLFGDRPEQYLRAAALFRKAASLPGAPKEARYMEARMYQATNRREMALTIWKRIYLMSPSAEERGVARRTLERFGEPLPRPPHGP